MVRVGIGVLARIVVLLGFVLIVADAVYTLADRGEWILAAVALVVSPITVFVWPIFGHGADIGGFPLWVALVASVVAYPISTFVGGLPPISRPRDLLDPATWVPPGGLTDEDVARATLEMDPADEQYAKYVFQQTAERYAARADVPDPALDADVTDALNVMREWLGDGFDEWTKDGLYKLGARAYLWRAVEEAKTRFADEELHAAIEASRTEGENRGPEEPRWVTLYHAASKCVESNVPVWLASPGGLLYGSDFYNWAFEHVRADLDEYGFEIDDNTQRLAFRYGVCLHDVENALVRLPDG